MNRRGFLKMLGLAVPAAVVAPIGVAESTPEMEFDQWSVYESRTPPLEEPTFHEKIRLGMPLMLCGHTRPIRVPFRYMTMPEGY